MVMRKPTKASQRAGHSADYTPTKQQHFDTVARVEISVVRASIDSAHRRWPNWAHERFLYLDLNAGPGYYDDLMERGSPIIMLNAARELGYPIEAHLFESNPETFESLRRNVAPYDGVHLHLGLSEDNVPPLLEDLQSRHPRGQNLGLIYADPTTYVQWDLLELITAKMTRVDFLNNSSTTENHRE